MAIPVFNEGTMRYHDPDSGRMVKSPTASLGSNLGSDGSILAALNTQTQLLTEVRDGMFGTAAEQRDELIGREETDEMDLGGGADVGERRGILDTLKGLNPFQDGIGTKMTIALLAGALFALTKLGPVIEEKLAGFLKWIKEDAFDDIAGGWEKLKEGFANKWNQAKEFFNWIGDTFVPKIVALYESAKKWWDEQWPKVEKFFTWMEETMFPKIAELYEGAKDWWGEQWPKVEKFFTWIQGIFTSVGDYVDTFDIDGDGKLNAEERAALFKEVREKITDGIVKYISGIALGILGLMFGPALIKGAITIASAKIAASVAGGSAATSAAAGAPVASTLAKTATKIGIAGVVVGGILGVYTAAKNAFANAAIDEQGNIDKESFAGFFIAGGDGDGGFKNAVENGINKAAIGGALAMGLKFATAGAAGGPMGILAAGLLGMAVGGLIGATTGAVGADKMTSVIKTVTDTIKQGADEVANFFGRTVAGIESFVKGEGFNYGVNAYIAKNAGSATDRATELELLQNEVEIERQLYEQRDRSKPSRGQRTALTTAENNLRNFKRKDASIEKAIADAKTFELNRAMDDTKRLPGLYETLATLDPNKATRHPSGKNAYERKLEEIKGIEAAVPGYMLSDLQMQRESGTGMFKALAPVIPTNFESTPMPMPSLIKEGDVSNFSTFTSGTLTPNDDYSTIRVLTLSGGLRQLN